MADNRDIVNRVYDQVKAKSKADRMAKNAKAKTKVKAKKKIKTPTLNFKENIRKRKKMLDEY